MNEETILSEIKKEIGDVKGDLRDVRVVLLGIPHTEDKGIVQNIRKLDESCDSIHKELRKMNGRVSWNTARIKAVLWVITIIAVLLGLTTAGLVPL